MKIAFCFLTYDIIIRNDVWSTFFENADPNKYMVFIHPKNLNYVHHYTFHYHILKKIILTTSKDNINIVKATLRLLEEAYYLDKDITHFIFLSQSCIPLYSFDILYHLITKSNYSIVSYINNNRKERYYQLSNNIKKYIHYTQFVKQQPNMMLIKEDVEKLIKYDYTNHFNSMICPDEHYFINIILYIFKSNIYKKQITFCNPDFSKTQALEFKFINDILIKKIRDHGFLFMRKTKKDSIIDINFLLKN
jgi:hypothetical protein